MPATIYRKTDNKECNCDISQIELMTKGEDAKYSLVRTVSEEPEVEPKGALEGLEGSEGSEGSEGLDDFKSKLEQAKNNL